MYLFKTFLKLEIALHKKASYEIKSFTRFNFNGNLEQLSDLCLEACFYKKILKLTILLGFEFPAYE